MRKALWATLFVVTLLTALPALAQNPNYDFGPVWRVTYYQLKPGQSEPFWKDFREHLKPSYDAVKKEGIITDYKVWTNVTTDGPHDWDVAVGLMFVTGVVSEGFSPVRSPFRSACVGTSNCCATAVVRRLPS